jgi:hypothetical protein
VASTGSPNLRSNRERIASGQSAPPVHTSVSEARSSGATASDVARLWSSAGGPFHVVTRSRRIHPATPSASMRSMRIEHPPACATSSVVSTVMLRIVNGKQSPLRRSGP